MPKPKLFDDDSEEENILLKTENEYAKKYDRWREKEELHKLEQKYGPNALNSNNSESSDSEDNDEPPEISEETEKQFLKTLAFLKTKDPRIYDPNFKCFENEEKEKEIETKKKTLSFADSDEDDDDGEIFKVEKVAPPPVSNKEKTPSKQKKSAKEDKLKAFLTGEAEHIDDDVARDLAPLKALWSDPAINEGEAFLRDYILNKRYLEEGGAGEAEDKLRDDEELEADEARVEAQGQFERAYNFRFEEPDHEYLKRYPRTMAYIRPKDERRARRRAELRARRDGERSRKLEEIARMKALKLKEIQEKIAKIKEVTGNQDLAFGDEDIEGDFDPEEHDRRMKALFDEQFYGDADDHKPEFPDLDEELEIENWEKYEKEADQASEAGEEPAADTDGPHCEDDDFNMDADYDPKQAKLDLMEELKSTMGKKRRNRKKKSKLAKLLTENKPKFVPTLVDKTYSEYMEEYYKMDCEDIIGGDLPTRFKYREVVPNDFGLSIEEILLADDKELTQWVPLKKIVKHRPENVEKGEVKTYQLKAADDRLKKKILPSLYKDLPEEPEIVVPVEEVSKKKKKKKKNKSNQSVENNLEVDDATVENEVGDTIQENLENNKKSKKNRKDTENNIEIKEDDVEPDELNDTKEVNKESKKKRKKKRKGKVEESILANVNTNNTSVVNSEGKKKKKKHKNEFEVETVVNQGPSHDDTVNELEDKNKEGNTSKEKSNKLKRKLEPYNEESNIIETPNKKKKQKKLDIGSAVSNSNQNNKKTKKKFKQKDKFKKTNNEDKRPTNPLTNLSDERLKAYGLNPKKYRSFLKYKKY